MGYLVSLWLNQMIMYFILRSSIPIILHVITQHIEILIMIDLTPKYIKVTSIMSLHIWVHICHVLEWGVTSSMVELAIQYCLTLIRLILQPSRVNILPWDGSTGITIRLDVKIYSTSGYQILTLVDKHIISHSLYLSICLTAIQSSDRRFEWYLMTILACTTK
jgi:hypothetical protein